MSKSNSPYNLKKRKKTCKAVERFWQAFYVSPGYHCSLCGNRGIIDTTETAVTAAGCRTGRRNCCICPNGMAIRFQDPNIEL